MARRELDLIREELMKMRDVEGEWKTSGLFNIEEITKQFNVIIQTINTAKERSTLHGALDFLDSLSKLNIEVSKIKDLDITLTSDELKAIRLAIINISLILGDNKIDGLEQIFEAFFNIEKEVEEKNKEEAEKKARLQRENEEFQQTIETRKYPQPRNDFERVMIAQFVPIEIFQQRDDETPDQFYERKYKVLTQYFVSFVIKSAWQTADNSFNSLAMKTLADLPLAVQGIEQPKKANDIISTLIQGVPQDEFKIANKYAQPMKNMLVALDLLNGIASKVTKNEGNASTSFEGMSEEAAKYDENGENNFWFPLRILKSLDFPLVFKDENGQWSEGGDLEPFKDKVFRAMKEMLVRRLFPEHREEKTVRVTQRIADGREEVVEVPSWKARNIRDIYNAIYIHVTPKASHHEHGEEHEHHENEILLPPDTFPAFHYDPRTRRRTLARVLKLKRLPKGPNGAPFPRTGDIKNGQLPEAVRRNILFQLTPPVVRGGERKWVGGSPIQYVEESNDFNYVSHFPANFAYFVGEELMEAGDEAAFQDARSKSIDTFGGVEAKNLRQNVYNPSLTAVAYLKGGEREKNINPFLIGWQSFLLDFFDYIILKGKNGKHRTLTQLILEAEEYDDVPWDKLNDDIVGNWLAHKPIMLSLAKNCFKGFEGGDLRNLAEVNVSTNQLGKINEKLAGEMISMYRAVRTYLLNTYSSPKGIIKTEDNPSKQIDAALETGQFMKIRIESTQSGVQSKEMVTRVQQFRMFDTTDITNWIPKKMFKDDRHGAKFVVQEVEVNGEKIPVRTMVVRIDASQKEMPDPEKILTQELVTQVLSSASSRGDILKSLSKEDYLILGIIFSKEIRENYEKKYYVSIGTQIFTDWLISFVNSSQGVLKGMVMEEDIKFELPQIGGPNLFTQDEFFIMLEKMGHKTTIEEMFHVGKTLVGAFSGESGSKKH